jgi:hypothetical protein
VVEDTVKRTTIGEFAPGPRGPHPHADADTGGDGAREYGGRRLPQVASADASRDEDGGKHEVVWETARFVCVTEAHHDETEEEPHRDEGERRGPYPTVGNDAPDDEHSERGDREAAAGGPELSKSGYPPNPWHRHRISLRFVTRNYPRPRDVTVRPVGVSARER